MSFLYYKYFLHSFLSVHWSRDARNPIFYEYAHLSPNTLISATETRPAPILLVIAHPDDECMFFTPTIMQLKSQKVPVHILCLSKGNFDGQGGKRMQEFRDSCKILGTRPIFAHSQPIFSERSGEPFPDGPSSVWQLQDMAKILAHLFIHHTSPRYQAIITFDKYGISGHTNHISAHQGVKHFIQYFDEYVPLSPSKPTALQLVSTNIFRKYSGWLDVFLSHFFWTKSHSRFLYLMSRWIVTVTSELRQIETNVISHKVNSLTPPPAPSLFIANFKALPQTIKCMKAHKTQFVWFRWLWVFFSRYTVMNTLEYIETS